MISVPLFPRTGDFAEDKDVAADIRENQIRPAANCGDTVVVDFQGVTLTTQSFLHALISDVLRMHGENLLERLVFKNCNEGIRGLIRTVVQYSLETVDSED